MTIVLSAHNLVVSAHIAVVLLSFSFGWLMIAAARHDGGFTPEGAIVFCFVVGAFVAAIAATLITAFGLVGPGWSLALAPLTAFVIGALLLRFGY